MDVFTEARNLVQRYEKGVAFRQHVLDRLNLVLPVLLLFLAFSIALSLGLLASMEKGALLAFFAVVMMPVILIGSLLLQAYLFFSWIELRALEAMLAHHRAPATAGTWLAKLQARLGKLPPIPWIAATLLLFIPFVLLVLASVKIAALVLVLGVLTPVVYAQLDRPQ